jgi:hypothetical protein
MAKQGFKYPAFFSYSRADESAWGDWCKDFHTVFSKAIAGELRNRGLEPARPFFDIENLQGKTQSVEANLREGVDASFALFIFLGPGYVNSEWCCRELAYFSQLHRGAQDMLLQRVWIFELATLDSSMRAQFRQRLATADASVLESQLRSVFLDPGTNRRPVLIREDMSINQGPYQSTVEPIVKELVGRIPQDTQPRPSAPSTVDVLIGLATPDLQEACAKLEEALVAAKRSVVRVTRDDLDNLSDVELVAKFGSARVVVVPVSAAKVLMQRVPGGHLAPQLDSLAGIDAGRIVVWRPSEAPALADAEAEADPKHLPTLADLLRRAGEASLATEVATRIERLLAGKQALSDGSEVVILVEEREVGDGATKDDVVLDLSNNWAELSPEGLRDTQCSFLSLNVATLGKNPRPVVGDAVIVFPDPDEDMMQSKCSLITRNMENWRKTRIPVRPGLIVETDRDEAEFVVSYWPKARFSQRTQGEPPKPQGFGDESKGNLRRFFNQIAQLKAAEAKKV